MQPLVLPRGTDLMGHFIKIYACGKTLAFSGRLPRTRPFYLRPWEPCLISLSSRLQEKFCQMASHFDEVGTKIAFGIIMWTPLCRLRVL